MSNVFIGIDFDGTLVTHDFPNIGREVPGAFDVLRDLQKLDFKLILFTMRSGEYLNEAVDYCKSKGIEFFGINTNPTQKTWTDSPKAYCNIYIDDAALGCPLTFGKHDRPFVNWLGVRTMLEEKGILKKSNKIY